MNAQGIQRKSLLISFSGIDGAGKSTQIDNLKAHLHTLGLRVDLIRFWDDVATFKRIREGAGHTLFKGEKGVGTPDAPVARRDKNIRTPLMTFVRMAMYLADALSLRRTARRALRSQAGVTIFDRYLYDELANLDPRNPILRFYILAIMKLAPRPAISFILDADPVQARARKPEYPLDFLLLNRNAYLTLSRLLGRMTVIPPLPLEQAKAQVVECVLTRMDRSSTASR